MYGNGEPSRREDREERDEERRRRRRERRDRRERGDGERSPAGWSDKPPSYRE
jgi:hypothetical protein